MALVGVVKLASPIVILVLYNLISTSSSSGDVVELSAHKAAHLGTRTAICVFFEITHQSNHANHSKATYPRYVLIYLGVLINPVRVLTFTPEAIIHTCTEFVFDR